MMMHSTPPTEWRRPVITDITEPNGKWRRPMIWDITPANYRPNAEQADARHGEIDKHWQQQRKRRSEETPAKPADVRIAYLRWSSLQRLMRRWYGIVMPDTDCARAHIEILINYANLTGKKPRHVAEIWAPWLPEDELDHMAVQRPVLHKKGDLGQKLGLLYCDRHAARADTIGCIDKTEAECEQLRCQRRNEAKRQKRAAAKQETNTMTTETAPDLKLRERKVLARIDGTEITVPELTKRLAGLKEFSKLAEPPQRQVHRIVDHLVALGLVADHYAPGPRGGRPIRHVSRPQQPSCAAPRRASSEG